MTTFGNVSLGRLGAAEPQRVTVRRRRNFDPTAPLAGLGYEAAASATDASIDVQQDMGRLRGPAEDAWKNHYARYGAILRTPAQTMARPAVRNDWFVQSIRRAHGKPGFAGMGSWLSKALKGDVGRVVGGVLDSVVPGAGAVVGIIGGNKAAPVVQPGTNAPVTNTFARPDSSQYQSQYPAQADDKKLPPWVIPSAIGVGVFLVALVAVKK